MFIDLGEESIFFDFYRLGGGEARVAGYGAYVGEVVRVFCFIFGFGFFFLWVGYEFTVYRFWRFFVFFR